MYKSIFAIVALIAVVSLIGICIFGTPTRWQLSINNTYIHSDSDRMTVYFKGSDIQVARSTLILKNAIADDGISHLRVLVMGAGGDGAIEAVSELPHVIDLFISSNTVTDSGLSSLTEMTQLRWLTINSGRITSRGIASLCDVKSLERLDIDNTAADDDCIDALIQLPNLKMLSIRDTRITANGVKRLRSDVAINR